MRTILILLAALSAACVGAGADPSRQNITAENFSAHNPEGCVPFSEIEGSASRGKCYVAMGGNAYDLTNSTKWSLQGHEGKHPCGKSYALEDYLSGPHNESTLGRLERYRLGKVC